MPVANARRTNPPGPRRMRWRKLTMGSSSAPVVPERERPSSARGRSGPRPRPRKRSRSLSHSMEPCVRPSRLRTCTTKSSSSSGERGRRRQRRAPHSGRNSDSTKSFPKAGCARSSAVGREDDLRVARDLDLSRTRSLWLVTARRRTSTSSSVETAMSSWVSDVVVAAVERRFLGKERDEVILGLLRERLMRRGPHRAAPYVAKVQELTSRIAGRIVAVARDGPTPAEARAPTRVRDDDGVVAVRQKLRVGEGRIGRAVATHRRRGDRLPPPGSPRPDGADSWVRIAVPSPGAGAPSPARAGSA